MRVGHQKKIGGWLPFLFVRPATEPRSRKTKIKPHFVRHWCTMDSPLFRARNDRLYPELTSSQQKSRMWIRGCSMFKIGDIVGSTSRIQITANNLLQKAPVSFFISTKNKEYVSICFLARFKRTRPAPYCCYFSSSSRRWSANLNPTGSCETNWNYRQEICSRKAKH